MLTDEIDGDDPAARYDQLRDLINKIIAKALDNGETELRMQYGNDDSREHNPDFQRDHQALRMLCYGQISQMLTPYLWMPDPGALASMADVLGSAMGQISTGAGNPFSTKDGPYLARTELDGLLHSSDDCLQNWTGAAAVEFKEMVIDRASSVTSNQFILLALLKSALEAEAELWHRARSDAVVIAENTLAVLNSFDHWTSHSATVAFTVVAAVGGAAISLIDPPLGVSIALNTVATAAWIAATVPPGDPPVPHTQPEWAVIEGQWTFPMIDSMTAAVNHHRTIIRDVEANLITRLNASMDAVTRGKHLFVAERPRLADANRRNITGMMGDVVP